jgi:hypothetical protein
MFRHFKELNGVLKKVVIIVFNLNTIRWKTISKFK